MCYQSLQLPKLFRGQLKISLSIKTILGFYGLLLSCSKFRFVKQLTA